MGTKIVESGVGTIASDESAPSPLSTCEVGRGCQSARSDLLEHRPDGADTFDTLYIGCEKFPYREAFSINVAGVLWSSSVI